MRDVDENDDFPDFHSLGSEVTYGDLGLDDEILRTGTNEEITKHLEYLQRGDPEIVSGNTSPNISNTTGNENVEVEFLDASGLRDTSDEIEKTTSRIPPRRAKKLQKLEAAAVRSGQEALNMYKNSKPVRPRGLLKGLDIRRGSSFEMDDSRSEADIEAEKIRRKQKRRTARVLDMLRTAIEDRHVTYPGLSPGGIPIELVDATTTKCMTKYTVRWTLPSELDMLDGNDFFECRNFDGADQTLESKRAIRIAEIRASKALEKVSGRLRSYMAKRARLRKAPVLHFKFVPASEMDDGYGVYDDDHSL
eukprot:g2636.t1